jgi:hypothetical protein
VTKAKIESNNKEKKKKKVEIVGRRWKLVKKTKHYGHIHRVMFQMMSMMNSIKH